jgi:hypothetical protein
MIDIANHRAIDGQITQKNAQLVSASLTGADDPEVDLLLWRNYGGASGGEINKSQLAANGGAMLTGKADLPRNSRRAVVS